MLHNLLSSDSEHFYYVNTFQCGFLSSFLWFEKMASSILSLRLQEAAALLKRKEEEEEDWLRLVNDNREDIDDMKSLLSRRIGFSRGESQKYAEMLLDFTKHIRINMEDLIPGKKYYIQKIQNYQEHTCTAQKYGIFSGFELYENKKTYALFRSTYNFKNPVTNEYLVSGMGINCELYCHRHHFVFYEPKMVTYYRKQNELLGKVIENITHDTYLARHVVDQGFMGLSAAMD